MSPLFLVLPSVFAPSAGTWSVGLHAPIPAVEARLQAFDWLGVTTRIGLPSTTTATVGGNLGSVRLAGSAWSGLIPTEGEHVGGGGHLGAGWAGERAQLGVSAGAAFVREFGEGYPYVTATGGVEWSERWASVAEAQVIFEADLTGDCCSVGAYEAVTALAGSAGAGRAGRSRPRLAC